MTEQHVSSERLRELAHLEQLSQESEWPHICRCNICASQLLEFVREILGVQREGADDTPDS